MITKRERSCLGTKPKCENKLVDKQKQMRSRRQNYKLKQWVMERTS